jgi:3-deoxy-D-manno-octulosonic-acid transferase
LLASSHPGEDAWIAAAIHEAAPEALAVLVPRHAERRTEVKHELEAAGFEVVLRSDFQAPTAGHRPWVFVIDSTGELRDWTAHADVVIIGKSFLATGGQNPSEAILAKKPVIFGPHMENFEPLASRLAAAQGCLRAQDPCSLRQAIITALDPHASEEMTDHASQVLACHEGATRRIIALLHGQNFS